MSQIRPARPLIYYVTICLAIMAMAASAEWAMGRRAISKSGRVLFWVNDPASAENSQQLFDWYSLSHLIHGMALYCILRYASRGKRPIAELLVLAVLVEACWEMTENSDFIINRYRQTMAQGYYGDTILNSMSDISCCIIGFMLARRLPVIVTLALVIAIEVTSLIAIRDNLALNIIMLIHPFAPIKHWQMGG